MWMHTRGRGDKAGRKVLCEVGSPASGWASSRRCLTCHPRGASRASHGRYEVNLLVVPAGDAFRSRGSPVVVAQAAKAPVVCDSKTVPLRQMAWRMIASLRATAIAARFQPMRLASRNAHSWADGAAGFGGSPVCLALSFLKVEVVLVAGREIGDKVSGPLVVAPGLEVSATNGPIVYGIVNWILGERSRETVFSNPFSGCLLS